MTETQSVLEKDIPVSTMETTQPPEPISESGLEIKFENTGSGEAASVIEIAKTEADRALAGFEVLTSTHDENTLELVDSIDTGPEITELEALAVEAKSEVAKALEELHGEQNKKNIAPSLDEMLETAEPASMDSGNGSMDSVSEINQDEAKKIAEAREVELALDVARQDDLSDKVYQAGQDLLGVEAALKVNMAESETAKRTIESLNDIGVESTQHTSEDLKALEVEQVELQKQIKINEERHIETTAEYAKNKKARNEKHSSETRRERPVSGLDESDAKEGKIEGEVEKADLDWEALISEEEKQLAAATVEYEKSARHLEEEKTKYPQPWAPIQQKYFEVLTADAEVSEFAIKHAQNQKELYQVNGEIAVLGEGADDAKLDTLISSRDAKDVLSKQLADTYEATKAKRDNLLESYTSALTHLNPEEAATEKAGEKTADDFEHDSDYYVPSQSRSSGYESSPSNRREQLPLTSGGGAGAPAKQKQPGLLSRIYGFFKKKVDDDVKAVTFQK